MALLEFGEWQHALHEVEAGDIEYLRHETGPLLARLYRPQRARGPVPLVIDLHGGAWSNGDRFNDRPINEALARTGIAVAAIEFRMQPAAGYPASLADINYAVRWFKSHAEQFGIRADRVGILGASSGGHQAMLCAMRPLDPRYAGIPLQGGKSVDARLACAVLCWPVIDPIGRFHYAKELQARGGAYPDVIDRVIPLHMTYWGSEEAMSEGSPLRALERGEPAELPPVLYMQGGADVVHPHVHMERFIAKYRERGGSIEASMHDGEINSFMINNLTSSQAQRAMRRVIDFVHQHLG